MQRSAMDEGASGERSNGQGVYQRVLVPLDGTPFAEAALEAARTLAERSGALGITVLTLGSHNMLAEAISGEALSDVAGKAPGPVIRHAMQLARLWDAELWLVRGVRPSLADAAPDPRDSSLPTNDPQGQAAARAHRGERAEGLHAKGMRARSKVLDGTEAAGALLRFVAMKKIGIVVMGSHGRNLIEPCSSGPFPAARRAGARARACSSAPSPAKRLLPPDAVRAPSHGAGRPPTGSRDGSCRENTDLQGPGPADAFRAGPRSPLRARSNPQRTACDVAPLTTVRATSTTSSAVKP